MILRFEQCDLDLARRTLRCDREAVSLNAKTFDLLVYLACHAERVVTKDELLGALWPDSFVEESNLSQHIFLLRKALAAHKTGERLILTIPGRGYQFAARVETVTDVPQDGPQQNLILHAFESKTVVVVEEEETDDTPGQMTPERALASPPRKRTALWIGTGLAATLAIAGGIYWHQRPSPALRKVLLADFENQTGESIFDESLQPALRVELEQSPYIDLMSRNKIGAALANMRKPLNAPLNGDTALEVCERENYQAVVNGTILRIGNQYLLTLEAVNCSTGENLAAEKARVASQGGVLSAMDSLSRKLRRELGEPRRQIAQYGVSMRDAMTSSLEAVKDYSMGSELGNAGKLEEAIPFFEHALELDPDFTMAQYGLATAHFNLGSRKQAAAEYGKAFQMSSGIGESDRLFVQSSYYENTLGDLDAAAKIWRLWADEYPDNGTPWIGLATCNMLRGHLNEAVAAAESAMTHGESRPPIYYTVLARAYMRDGRFADAKRIAAQAQAANSEDLDLHQILHSMAIAERDQPTLTREGEWLSKQQSTWSFMESQAVYAADQGKLTESERLFPEAAAEALHENLPELAEGIREDLVTVEIQLGHNKKAVEVMRQFRDPDPLNQAGFEADLGLFGDAKKHLREAQASAPTPIKSADGTTTTNTIQTYIQIPYAQASIALHRGNPRQAIALLEPARPYEFAAPAIISLRGQAYLLLGDGVHAAAEFQRLIDYPGLEDPMYPQTCIAHLQLARAYVLQNKADIARVEYRKFFDLWKDADPDLPALAQARSEYAKLDSSRRY